MSESELHDHVLGALARPAPSRTAASMTSCALIDSGLFVNEMSLVRTPLSSVLDTPDHRDEQHPPDADHPPRVPAARSSQRFRIDPHPLPTSLSPRPSRGIVDVRCMLTVYVLHAYGVSRQPLSQRIVRMEQGTETKQREKLSRDADRRGRAPDHGCRGSRRGHDAPRRPRARRRGDVALQPRSGQGRSARGDPRPRATRSSWIRDRGCRGRNARDAPPGRGAKRCGHIPA